EKPPHNCDGRLLYEQLLNALLGGLPNLRIALQLVHRILVQRGVGFVVETEGELSERRKHRTMTRYRAIPAGIENADTSQIEVGVVLRIEGRLHNRRSYRK